MMQPPMQGGGVPPQGAPQGPPQGGINPQEADAQVGQLFDNNPEMGQQIHAALQQNGMQEQFAQIDPQEIQGMVQAFTQIVEQPETYPQVYQQLMEAGGANPEDFPPPDSPPELVKEFATKALLVIYYMGKLGQRGGQGGGQPPSPPGGMAPQGGGQPPPQGGIQGYPHGGVVGQGQQLQTGYDSPHRMKLQNYANLMLQRQELQQAPQASQAPITPQNLQQQAGTGLSVTTAGTAGTPGEAEDSVVQYGDGELSSHNIGTFDNPLAGGGPGTWSDFQGTEGEAGTEGVQHFGGYGSYYTGAAQMPIVLAERDLLRTDYAASAAGQASSAASKRSHALLGGKTTYGGYGRGSMTQGSWNDPNVYNTPGAAGDLAAYKGVMGGNFGSGKRGAGELNAMTNILAMQPISQATDGVPWEYYRQGGWGMPGINIMGRQSGNAQGASGAGWTSDPWTTMHMGAGGVEFQTPQGTWFDNKSGRAYPVKSQEQLDLYTGAYKEGATDEDRSKAFYSGTPWFNRDDYEGQKTWAEYYGATDPAGVYASQMPKVEREGLPGSYGYKKRESVLSSAMSGAHGMMVPPTNNPQNFGTGDDQMIAAKTGEGVLNVDAVDMIGGPQAVNQLNYQATGVMPGPRPVQGAMAGYEYGGNVRPTPEDDLSRMGAGYAGAGYAHGGMVGNKQAITSSGWTWDEATQKYAQKSQRSRQFSGRTMQAMGFFGSFFGKLLGLVVVVAAAAFTGGAALPALMAVQAGSTAALVAGAVIGAAAGAASAFLSTGSWQAAVGGAVLGGLGGAYGQYTAAGGSLSTMLGGESGATAAGGAWGTGAGPTTGIGPEAIPQGGLTNQAAAVSGGFNPAAMQQQSIFGGAAPGGAGPTLDPFASQTGGPLLSGGPQGLGQAGVVGNTGLTTNTQGINGQQIGDGSVVQNILKDIMDPRNLLKGGLTTLGGSMGSEDFGAKQGLMASGTQLAKQSEVLQKQNNLLDLQTEQYTQNQIPLANQATGMAQRFASPMAGGVASFNADKLRSSRELEEAERRMLSRGAGSGGPGGAAFEANLRDLRNDQRLSSTNAFNKGINDRMALGGAALAGAAQMSPAPDYNSLASSFGNAASATNQANLTYANTREAEVNAGNQNATSFADLLFPADREKEKQNAQGTSINFSFARGGMVGRPKYAY